MHGPECPAERFVSILQHRLECSVSVSTVDTKKPAPCACDHWGTDLLGLLTYSLTKVDVATVMHAVGLMWLALLQLDA